MIIFYAIECCAQGHFKNGFILTAQKDTVVGQIQYRSNSKNYRSCVFMSDDKLVEYSAVQINGFGYINDRFFSSLIVKDSFVEVLVAGSLSLYRFENYFLLEKAGTIYKLEDEEQVKVVNGVTVKGSDNKWKGKLSFLIYDRLPNVIEIVANMPFSEESLTKIVIRYNKCSQSDFTEYKKQKPWSKVNYGVSIGLEKTSIHIEDGTSLNYLPDYYNSIDPTIGFVLAISSPRISERFALQPEIHLTKSDFSGSKIYSLSSYQSEYIDSYIDLTTLSLPISIRYSFLGDKHPIFVQGGINYEYILMSKTNLQLKLVTVNDTYTYPESAAFEINKSNLGFWGGLGVLRSFNRFQLSANIRYYHMMDISKAINLVALPNHLTLSIIVFYK